MSDYDNTNTGALFKNKKKEKDTHPDMTGSINIEGVDYWVSGWTKTSKSDERFVSLSFKRKDADAPVKAKPAPAEASWDDTDLPF